MLVRDAKMTRRFFRAIVLNDKELLVSVILSLKEGDRIGQLNPVVSKITMCAKDLVVFNEESVSDQTEYFKASYKHKDIMDGEYSWNDDQVWRKA